MTRNHLFGLIVAACAFAAAATPNASAQSAADQTAAAPAAPLAQIQTYYDGVKDIFRQTAVMLGGAVGAERPPLINIQNHCSRSLGQLRAILRQAQGGGGATPQLAQTAATGYQKCKSVFDRLAG